MKKNKIALALNTCRFTPRTTITVSAFSTLMLLSSPIAIAQSIDDKGTEIISVSGVRSSLENALNLKREANNIVDAISAADIDSLPALDLGEALQAIPGIQLNRDDGTRDSEISLRGLPGGYVKVTAEGQSFATPSRSNLDVGASNPFGSFEASIFDGVTVVKSPTADMQEGGISGVVDKKLQRALSKKDGKYTVNLGSRFEELSDNWNNEFRLSGVNHLIKDKLGVAFKIAGSEQNFRRDTANFTQYTTLNTTVTPDLEAYKTLHNLPENAAIKAISRSGQVSEVANGDRFSATVNIEYKVNDDLKIGAHYLHTKRTLDESNFEDVQFSVGNNANDSRVSITPLGTPFALNSNADGTPVYAVSHTRITNVNWAPANRLMSFTESADGVFLYADYVKDNWTIDGTTSYSKSLNEFQNQGLDVRHTTSTGRVPIAGVPNNQRPFWAPTGIDVEIDTGRGDLSQARTTATGFGQVNYDAGTWSDVALSGFSSRLDPLAIDNRRVEFFVNGRVDRPERTMKSVELNAKRFVDFGSDALAVSAVKFGFRHSTEELINTDLRIGGGGINTRALTTENIFADQLFTEIQAPYFNGDYPGAYDAAGGWWTIDSRNLRRLLQTDMMQLEGAQVAEPTGFFVRTADGLNQFFRSNFAVEQDISAIYAMADFTGELAGLPYTGNLGVRHVRTSNDITGSSTQNGAPVQTFTETDYNHSLPSFNASLELSEDLVLRVAFAKAIVRPNLRAVTPSGTFDDGPANVRIDFPRSDIEPYTSDNYDLSLEWYNREGSAVSIGAFRKEITGLFQQETICPVGQEGSPAFGGLFGPLEAVPLAGETLPRCQEVNPFVTEDGEVLDNNREVRITRSFNSDETIKVKGYELAVQQKLDFLPYPWNGFGGVFNYTYVDTDEGANTRMTRISPRSYNIITYWENDGVSVRFSYNWRDVTLLDVGGNTSFLGSDAREQTAGGRLDLSASYKVNKKLKLNLLGYNLNNNQDYEFTGGNKAAISRVRYSGRTYQVSASYSF
jgi:TonB-dependent receptor